MFRKRWKLLFKVFHNHNNLFLLKVFHFKILSFFFLFLCFISVSPESVVIPIVSCIFGFPLLALLVICCLRKRAKLARERDRRRNYDMQDHAVSLVRFSPIHRLCESEIKTKSSLLLLLVLLNMKFLSHL